MNPTPLPGAVNASGQQLDSNQNIIGVANASDVVKPVSLPTGTPPSTTADGVHGAIGSTLDQITQANNTAVSNAQSATDSSKGVLQAIYDKIAGVQGSRVDEETKQGVPQDTLDLTKAQNDLNASKAARQSELLSLQGQGLTDIQKQQQTAEINRKYATADITLGVALSAAQGNLLTAKNLVDSKIKMELEPLQTQLEEAKTFYNDNERSLSEAQKSALTDKISALKDQYTQVKADRKEVSDNYTKLLETNPQFLKSNPNVAAKLATAQNGMEFDKILSDNGGSLVKPVVPGSGPKGTVAEREASAVNKFSNAFVPGAKMKNGIPLLDSAGQITPEAWQAAIKDAPAEGLTRQAFIKQFGGYIYNGQGVSSKYGLTPTEIKLITGSISTS